MSSVEQYYNQHTTTEWQRLERHRTEFAVTLRAFTEFLPPPPAAILDVGGGPGRYAIALSQQGYQVTLVDVAQQNLILAVQYAATANVQLAEVVHANALDLTAIPSATYDVVLLLGPLYHLLTAHERKQAVQEALRVLKSSGILFAAFITRFAPFRNAAKHNPLWLIQNRAYAEQLLNTGVHDRTTSFVHAYFAHPAEICPFMEDAGLQTLELIGCEGVVSEIEEQVNQLTGEAWETWVDLNYRLGKERTLHGAAEHLLYIGIKHNAS
jgi:S-adenosylmethionine-dependent methyltransferase